MTEVVLEQSKLSLKSGAGVMDDDVKTSLKLGLFSYPVLQAADILVYRWVCPWLACHLDPLNNTT